VDYSLVKISKKFATPYLFNLSNAKFMKKSVATSLLSIFLCSASSAQPYTSHAYVGTKSAFGLLYNPYTNSSLKDVNERMNLINMIEIGAEGMDYRFYVNFKSDVVGLLPDYLFMMADKNNRRTVYGTLLKEFNSTYNRLQQQDYHASFSDFDVMGGNFSLGYKYIYFGGNLAWAFTTIQAY